MCYQCGLPDTLPCNCSAETPFCHTCLSNVDCDQKFDAACVVYNYNNPLAVNKLTCLGLPNGVSVKAFMEKVDAEDCYFRSKAFVASILTKIGIYPDLLAQFCELVSRCDGEAGCCCYNFLVVNTSGDEQPFNYVDCDGVAHENEPLDADSQVEICARSVSHSEDEVGDVIFFYNLGECTTTTTTTTSTTTSSTSTSTSSTSTTSSTTSTTSTSTTTTTTEACINVSFVGVPALPDAQVNVYYDYTITLNGTAPFALEDVIAPAWMTVALTGNAITLTGVPQTGDIDTGVLVSFKVTNCSVGEQNFNDFIDVANCTDTVTSCGVALDYYDNGIGTLHIEIEPGADNEVETHTCPQRCANIIATYTSNLDTALVNGNIIGSITPGCIPVCGTGFSRIITYNNATPVVLTGNNLVWNGGAVTIFDGTGEAQTLIEIDISVCCVAVEPE